MRRWLWLFVTCALPPVSAHAQMVLEKDDVHVGDKWSFQQTDGFTSEITSQFTRRVVAVSDKEITAYQEIKDSKDRKTIYYDKDWNLLDTGDVRYTPAMKQIPFPVHLGDAWKTQYKFTSSKTGQSASCFSSGKFLSVETISVPAGTFRAGRIELNAECWGTDANAEVARYQNLEWYAPGVGRVIRGEYAVLTNGRVRSKSVVELTGYQRAQPDKPDAQAAMPSPALPTATSKPPASSTVAEAALPPLVPHPTAGPQNASPQNASPQNASPQNDSAVSYQQTLPLAEAGQRDAEFRVGRMLEQGAGVEKDLAKAAEWYRRSAEHGMPLAMLNYGLSLQAGQGVAKDEVAGAAWIMKAAEAGQPTAQANLGALYRSGRGLPRNIIKRANGC